MAGPQDTFEHFGERAGFDLPLDLSGGTPFQQAVWSALRRIAAGCAGEVVARNEALDGAPETVNSDAYGAGWMVELRPADPASLDALLSAADYRALVEKA